MDYTLQALISRVQKDKLDDDEFDATTISNFINDAQLKASDKDTDGTLSANSAKDVLEKLQLDD